MRLISANFSTTPRKITHAWVDSTARRSHTASRAGARARTLHVYNTTATRCVSTVCLSGRSWASWGLLRRNPARDGVQQAVEWYGVGCGGGFVGAGGSGGSDWGAGSGGWRWLLAQRAAGRAQHGAQRGEWMWPSVCLPLSLWLGVRLCRERWLLLCLSLRMCLGVGVCLSVFVSQPACLPLCLAACLTDWLDSADRCRPATVSPLVTSRTSANASPCVRNVGHSAAPPRPMVDCVRTGSPSQGSVTGHALGRTPSSGGLAAGSSRPPGYRGLRATLASHGRARAHYERARQHSTPANWR